MISTALTSATSAPSRTSIHSAKHSGSRWPSNGAHSPSSNRSRRSFFSGRMLRQRIHRAAVTVLFAAAILDAQVAVRWDARRPLAPYRQLTAARTAAVDTLRLLGLMVEFDYEEVDDGRTAGTGRFDTSTTHPAVIDPPPHNAAFF